MILFTVLLITVLLAIVIAALAAGTLGTAVAIVFGDVIVCALLIGLIVKCLKKKKKDK